MRRCNHSWKHHNDTGNRFYCTQCGEIIFPFDRIAELEAAQSWQPIESAPRDGENILLCGRYAFIGRWVDKFPPIYGGTDAGWYYPHLDRRVFPTHWMPIPTPPGENK